MSGVIKRRRSKWDDKDSEAFPEEYYDRASSRRPREPFSPVRSSRRHDSRSRENTMTLDREGNYSKISPEQDDWIPQNSSRSPRNGWGRSHRFSRSRSRSRSQSPAQNFRRESAINVRSRNRSGTSGQICRDFAAGRCRRGNSCHFLHQDAHDSRQPLEHGPSDDFEGRRRRTGSSRYSPDDIEDNSIRIEKSAHICNDFLKGRCRRGDTCKFVHHDSSDVFEKGPVEDVYRNKDHEHRSRDHRDRSRDIYLDHDHRSRDIYPDDHKSKDEYPDRDHVSKVTYPDRDHVSKVTYPDRDHVSKDRYPDRDHVSKDRYPDRDHGSKDTFPGRHHGSRNTYPDRDHGSRDAYPDRHGSRDAYPDSDHGSRDAYPDRDHGRLDKYHDHDHGSKDTYLDRDHRSRDKYSDHDHRRKDMYTDRNHESEPHRRVEIPCKFFASGNCRNGNRCRFAHQVQEIFSSEKSRNDKCDTDRNFDGSHDWDGPRWSDATVVSAVPTVPGWEEDRSEKKEVVTVRIQDDEGGLDRKNGDRVWDGPSWNDATTTPIVPVVQGWGDGNTEIREAAKDVTGTRPSNDSWGHDMLVKPIWDPPATSVDKSQIEEQVDPLQWNTENNTPIISLSTPRVDINSGVEISPRDVKQQTIFNSSTLQTPSNSNIAFAPVQQGIAGENSSFEKHYHTDVFGEQNPSIRDNKPISYPGERRDVVGDHNAPSVIQNQAITVPQGQTVFQSDKNFNVHPIPITTPPIQSQAPDLSHAPQVEAMQEVSYQPLSSENKVAARPHSFGLASSAPAPGASHGVSNEQLAQLSHITASLTQLLESRQQFSQLNSSFPSHGMPNLPDLAAPGPPVSGASIKLNQAPEVLKQYDPVSSITEQKNAIDVTHSEGYKLNSQEILGPSQDEENVKVTAEFKPADNGPSQDVGPDDGADEGKNLKDTKGIRPFKFALAEFVKELLKPSWKDGHVSKDAYKTIVKKVVEKVMETLGHQIPQTKEKIDLYLSSSKLKIDKLVQAYVGKHRKG